MLPCMSFPSTPVSAFQQRRAALGTRLATPAVVFSGSPAPRNYPANTFPFRATSHFLYLVGEHLPESALVLADGEATLFTPAPTQDDALWHGATRSLDQLRDAFGLTAVRPVDELDAAVSGLGPAATFVTQDPTSTAWATRVLGRAPSPESRSDADLALVDAMIAQRLQHDEAAVAQLRAAAEASAAAHVTGMRATRAARTEAEVCAAITGALYREDMADAYGPIVTVHGEVLHQHAHKNRIAAGDLLLCDVGGESPEGWASDITRTWPVSGTFSASQRAMYEVVLRAQVACVDAVRPGASYRAIHDLAKRTLVEGLVALGVLRGSVDGLLERGAAALFFPHGIGHLLGLDVHDMEDLGDRAGYAPGRVRSKRFGDRFLRLDRDLVPGMAVTIEPGFYQVPAILDDPALTGPIGADLDRAVLAKYADVRGIRIEDDVLCTAGAPEVLSRSCPKDAREIERIVRGD